MLRAFQISPRTRKPFPRVSNDGKFEVFGYDRIIEGISGLQNSVVKLVILRAADGRIIEEKRHHTCSGRLPLVNKDTLVLVGNHAGKYPNEE